jgi:carboxymethylenebutenolidase
MTMGTAIAFRRADGKAASGYLAKPGRDHAPGVIVIQEWWGLQDQIKGICDRLARAGYEALAPDLYAGVSIPYHDSEAASREMSSLNFLDATDNIVRGAALYLGQSGAKVGLTGFCLGGAVTLLGAVRVPEIAAACCFYGIPPEQAAHPRDIKVPFQGHFATRDDWCTAEAVARRRSRSRKFFSMKLITPLSTSSAASMTVPLPSWPGAVCWNFGINI